MTHDITSYWTLFSHIKTIQNHSRDGHICRKCIGLYGKAILSPVPLLQSLSELFASISYFLILSCIVIIVHLWWLILLCQSVSHFALTLVSASFSLSLSPPPHPFICLSLLSVWSVFVSPSLFVFLLFPLSFCFFLVRDVQIISCYCSSLQHFSLYLWKQSMCLRRWTRLELEEFFFYPYE